MISKPSVSLQKNTCFFVNFRWFFWWNFLSKQTFIDGQNSKQKNWYSRTVYYFLSYFFLFFNESPKKMPKNEVKLQIAPKSPIIDFFLCHFYSIFTIICLKIKCFFRLPCWANFQINPVIEKKLFIGWRFENITLEPNYAPTILGDLASLVFSCLALITRKKTPKIES